MNFQIVRVLEQDELRRLVPGLARGKFVDGKLTAEGLAREVKNNLQAERSGPELTDLDQIVFAAVRRNLELQSFTFAKRIMLPLFNRYEEGMHYGPHVDSAIMGKGAEQIRTDLSMTIFLSDPDSYEGGELILESPLGEDEIKLDSGEAVVYPSTTIHRVAPVTRGVRLAAVTWIQSSVPDERLRAILFGERARAFISERLASMAKSIRLPGFRPGRIPVAVIESRYGAKARAEILQRLAGEAADQVLSRGELAASTELVEGAHSGDVQFRLLVTHLPELPPVDLAGLKFERLRVPQSKSAPPGINAESARQQLEDYLRQQVLDFLDEAYRFPLAPVLVDREYALIRRAADEALAADSITRTSTERDAITAERDAIKAELTEIAERRVRLGAVIVEMARRYEIRVSASEVEAGRQSGETPARTAQRIQEDKVIAWFLSHTGISERDASDEELRELLYA